MAVGIALLSVLSSLFASRVWAANALWERTDVQGFCVSSDKSTIGLFTEGGYVELWSASDNRPIARFRPKGGANGIAFSSNNEFLAVTHAAGVRVWHLVDHKGTKTIGTTKNGHTAVLTWDGIQFEGVTKVFDKSVDAAEAAALLQGMLYHTFQIGGGGFNILRLGRFITNDEYMLLSHSFAGGGQGISRVASGDAEITMPTFDNSELRPVDVELLGASEVSDKSELAFAGLDSNGKLFCVVARQSSDGSFEPLSIAPVELNGTHDFSRTEVVDVMCSTAAESRFVAMSVIDRYTGSDVADEANIHIWSVKSGNLQAVGSISSKGFLASALTLQGGKLLVASKSESVAKTGRSHRDRSSVTPKINRYLVMEEYNVASPKEKNQVMRKKLDERERFPVGLILPHIEVLDGSNRWIILSSDGRLQTGKIVPPKKRK